MWNALFGGPVPAPAAPPVPEKTPAEKIKEQLKGWQANLRTQMRAVDRTVRGAFCGRAPPAARGSGGRERWTGRPPPPFFLSLTLCTPTTPPF
jgi:hypothetical protein